jgi:hypothetical protein
MGSTDSRAGSVAALFRLVTRPRGRHVGSDGLTDVERAKYAARFWAVAKTPPLRETRLRVRDEVQAGTRPVIHLRRTR